VTVVPVREDGRIVLIRRVDLDRWVLPGGFLDWGETLAEAGARETREETGLEVVRTGRLVGVYSAPDRDPRAHCITVLMEAEVRGEPRVSDPLEVREIRAFASSELPFSEMVLGSDAMVRDYLAGRTVLA
jgi:ADP-ribose pyrophosphatase YjhB (NUDIX family)